MLISEKIYLAAVVNGHCVRTLGIQARSKERSKNCFEVSKIFKLKQDVHPKAEIFVTKLISLKKECIRKV